MAEILLHPRELERGTLPSVCAVCGVKEGTPVKTKLHVAVAEHALTRTLRVQDAWLPLCQRHQWHFQRATFYLLGFVACFVGTLPVMACYAFTIGQLLRDTSFGWMIGLSLALGMIGASFILAAIGRRCNVQAIQAVEITAEGVLVINVSERFAEAVISARQAKSR